MAQACLISIEVHILIILMQNPVQLSLYIATGEVMLQVFEIGDLCMLLDWVCLWLDLEESEVGQLLLQSWVLC